ADSSRVHVVDLATGKKAGAFQGHREPVNCMAISEDGKFLATGSDDCTVLLWDAAARVAEVAAKPAVDPADLPVKATLVANKKECKADPEARDKLIFHEVDLELELRNVTKKEVKLRLLPRPGFEGDEIEVPGNPPKKVKLKKEEAEALRKSSPPAGYVGLK